MAESDANDEIIIGEAIPLEQDAHLGASCCSGRQEKLIFNALMLLDAA
jgi:hypothetical protein